MVGDHLEECTDEELEDFLQRSRALVLHLLPEPDDYALPTTAGFVSPFSCKVEQY